MLCPFVKRGASNKDCEHLALHREGVSAGLQGEALQEVHRFILFVVTSAPVHIKKALAAWATRRRGYSATSFALALAGVRTTNHHARVNAPPGGPVSSDVK